MDQQKTNLLRESADAIRALRDYIQAIPDDVAATLPAMVGIDGDWLDQVQNRLEFAVAAPSAFAPGHPTDGVEQAWLLIRAENVEGGESAQDVAVLAVLDGCEWYVAGDWKAESRLDSVHADGGWIVGWMHYAVPCPVLAKL